MSKSSVSYNSDNFLLEHKYLVGVGGATPKNYTIAYNRVYMSEIDYSLGVYWHYMFYCSSVHSIQCTFC